ncbi:MAG: SIS domain-containing protein [Candidatus Omnitrophica bacterium]|nr:SIS domain-containing protein [Candidatus Omnitrophota bacterium]
MKKFFDSYQGRLSNCMQSYDWSTVERLAQKISSAQEEDRHIFLCGNGGSAANAIHIANDFLCLRSKGKGAKVVALPANQAILTCLANDTGYENIFASQLEQLGGTGDILIALSGSGNSSNILKAIAAAKKMGILTCAILGFDGGKCLSLVDIPIHFAVKDMQIAEDLQLIVGHMLMQWFKKGPSNG